MSKPVSKPEGQAAKQVRDKPKSCVTGPITGTDRKTTAGDGISPIGYYPGDDPNSACKATAGDHLATIVEAIRQLPEAQQAEVVRRLGDSQPDLGLAAIVAAWPKLPPVVRAGVASAVEGFAAR